MQFAELLNSSNILIRVQHELKIALTITTWFRPNLYHSDDAEINLEKAGSFHQESNSDCQIASLAS